MINKNLLGCLRRWIFMDPYAIIVKPHVTEKTMNLIDQNNELAFVVRRESSKYQIKKAFEQLYGQEVERVNTHITSKGIKLAYIKLVGETEAEDVAVKMGVF
jgi:large subunit ribosomal protein L23